MYAYMHVPMHLEDIRFDSNSASSGQALYLDTPHPASSPMLNVTFRHHTGNAPTVVVTPRVPTVVITPRAPTVVITPRVPTVAITPRAPTVAITPRAPTVVITRRAPTVVTPAGVSPIGPSIVPPRLPRVFLRWCLLPMGFCRFSLLLCRSGLPRYVVYPLHELLVGIAVSGLGGLLGRRCGRCSARSSRRWCATRAGR